MKNKIAVQSLGAFMLIASGIAFGQTQVPNTFQAGQPARAAEVNDNFSTLETAINTNAQAIADNSLMIGNHQGVGPAQREAIIQYLGEFVTKTRPI